MSPLRRGDGPAMRFRCGKANLCLHAPDAGSGTYNHRARDARAEFKRYRIFRAGVKATTEVPGRGRGARTPDLRFWRPPLYQLSYTPSSNRAACVIAPPHLIWRPIYGAEARLARVFFKKAWKQRCNAPRPVQFIRPICSAIPDLRRVPGPDGWHSHSERAGRTGQIRTNRPLPRAALGAGASPA